MRWEQLVAAVVTLAVGLAVVGIVVNFFVRNELLFASEMQAGAAVTLGFVLLAVGGFALVGRPWTRWKRTPYW